jgi:hypothetical protein
MNIKTLLFRPSEQIAYSAETGRSKSRNKEIVEGPRSRRYGRTAALRLLVQPYDGDDDDDYYFLSFF